MLFQICSGVLDAVIKRSEREASRLFPSNADFRNEWTYIPF